MVGAFSPLEGFMDENNYNSVIKNNRNSDGLLFGLPIVFDSNNEKVKAGETILLTYKKQKIAVLEVSSKWEPDKSLEAELCYGTNSLYVKYLTFPGISSCCVGPQVGCTKTTELEETLSESKALVNNS